RRFSLHERRMGTGALRTESLRSYVTRHPGDQRRSNRQSGVDALEQESLAGFAVCLWLHLRLDRQNCRVARPWQLLADACPYQILECSCIRRDGMAAVVDVERVWFFAPRCRSLSFRVESINPSASHR